MHRLLATLIVLAVTALTGCQSVTNYLVEHGQPAPQDPPHASACQANLTRMADGQSAGILTVRPGALRVNVEGQLVGLPPNAELTATVRRNHGTSVEEAGRPVRIFNTDVTGLVGPIHTSQSGTAIVKLTSENLRFSEDKLIGRGLCITDAEGNLVASGVLGISEEH